LTVLIDDMLAARFEHPITWPQQAYYALERDFGHLVMRRGPPTMPGDQLLNLGCGPHPYPGWVNADDYAVKRGLREQQFRPNWRLDIGRPWKCPDDHWDGIFTQHVLEMMHYSKAALALREAFRTLKPGAWLRVVLPDFRRYLAVYNGAQTDFPPLPHPLLWISNLTQMHLARSTWDADLLIQVLGEIGFTEVAEVTFGAGSDPRLLKDGPEKEHQSFYVEARKPLAG
jgi:predicted SAM-dependent methyltransferase